VKKISLTTFLVFVSLSFSTLGLAQEQPVQLRIGMKESAPFTMKDADGNWVGISAELWQQIAQDLQLSYEIEERDLKGLLAGVQDGSLDMVVGALTITEEREALFDFSNSFFNTGLSIAARKEQAGFTTILRSLFNWQLLRVVLLLSAGLIAMSLLVWFFEKRHPHNPQSHQQAVHGVGWSLWWAIITLIGYEDRQPISFGGRFLAIVWMIASVVGVSILTAVLTSVMTVSRLENSIQGPEDLFRVQVASLEASTSASYLDRQRIVYQRYPSILEGLQAVADGEVDAMVYDQPLLRYLVLNNFKDQLEVLEVSFEPQNYAFALPEGSSQREAINRTILKFTSQDSWRDLQFRYLGN
jgi:polar amino acid transport system substrate-binding protein